MLTIIPLESLIRTCLWLLKNQRLYIREYLAKECSGGRVLGPLYPSEFPYVHTSRFGVIPKGSPGKRRLIVDMSSPEGASINDGIPRELCLLSYVSVKDAAQGILE